MEGITIIREYIYINPMSFIFIFAPLILLLIFINSVLIESTDDPDEHDALFKFIETVIEALGILILAYSFAIMSTEIRYEVKVNDEVSLSESYSMYNVISVEDDTYVVELRK